jgi:uncharacterized protein (DUF58 family)
LIEETAGLLESDTAAQRLRRFIDQRLTSPWFMPLVGAILGFAAAKATRQTASRMVLSVLLATAFFALLRTLWLSRRQEMTRVSLTAEGRVALWAALALWLLALNTGSSLLYVLVAMVLGLLIAARLAAELGLRGLKLRRLSPESAPYNQNVSVELQLRNDRRFLPALGLIVDDECALDLGSEKARTFFPWIGARSTEKVCYPLRFKRRGRWPLELLDVRSADPLGLVEKSSPVRFPTSILVWPRCFVLDAAWMSRLQGVGDSGRQRLLGAEDRDRVRSLRSYFPGDSPRSVHWRLSARFQKIIVREFERPEPRRYLIIVSGYQGQARDNLDLACSLAASILEALTRSSGSVALFTGNGPALQSNSEDSLHAALDLLAELEPDSPDIASRNGVSEMNGFQRILVSPLPGTEASGLALRIGASHVISVADGLETWGRWLDGEP